MLYDNAPEINYRLKARQDAGLNRRYISLFDDFTYQYDSSYTLISETSLERKLDTLNWTWDENLLMVVI